MNFDHKLDLLVARREELTQLMSSEQGSVPEEFIRLSKEYAELTPIVECIDELRALQNEIADLGGMVADTDSESAIRSLAEEEMRDARDRLPSIEKRLNILLLPKNAADEKNAILEVRAGTGGE